VGEQAWLSFEQRVRERRARRCEQAADAAIAAGAPEDALAAIDELALVLPSHPRIAELRERAASPARAELASDAGATYDVIIPDTVHQSLPLQDAWLHVPAFAEHRPAPGDAPPAQLTHTAARRGGFVALLSALAMLCLAFAAGSWWWVTQQAFAPEESQVESPQDTPAPPLAEPDILPAPVATGPSPAEQPARSDQTASAASVDTEPLPPPPATPPPDQSDISVEESASRNPRPDREPQPHDSVPASVVVRSPVPAAETETSPDRPPAPLASVAAPIGTAGSSTPPAASLSTAGAIQPLNESLPPRPAPPSAPPTMAANTTAPAIDPTAHLVAGVRQVLDRYAQGYSSRQATLVRQVWPEVDARALERAFGQLDSQDVRFNDCRIEAAETAASATCTGMASWVPAVGDRSPRHQSRTWRFALARDGQGWIITQARVAAR